MFPDIPRCSCLVARLLIQPAVCQVFPSDSPDSINTALLLKKVIFAKNAIDQKSFRSTNILLDVMQRLSRKFINTLMSTIFV